MQITEHVHALKIPFQIPVGPGNTLERFVYSYLVLGQDTCLIDSGVKNSHERIFEYLKDIGRKPEEIAIMVLTHAHPDHIGSARTIKEATGCIAAAHPGAREWIEDVDLQFRERPVPGFHELVGGSTPVERLLADGEIIELGEVSLEVIDTPGHAEGSISLYCREEGVLFTGDAVPQTNDLPIYEDVAATVNSINRLKGLPVINRLLASWTEPLAGEAANKMMDDGLEYLQRIHRAIREVMEKKKIEDPMELCAEMVSILGLPGVAINPLIAKSFVSHLARIDREKLY